MSRLYSKLAGLQKQLAAAKTDEQREAIEDEIAEVEYDLEQEETDRYSGDLED